MHGANNFFFSITQVLRLRKRDADRHRQAITVCIFGISSLMPTVKKKHHLVSFGISAKKNKKFTQRNEKKTPTHREINLKIPSNPSVTYKSEFTTTT